LKLEFARDTFEHGGTLAGLALVFGFSVAVLVTVLERAAG